MNTSKPQVIQTFLVKHSRSQNKTQNPKCGRAISGVGGNRSRKQVREAACDYFQSVLPMKVPKEQF